LQAWIVLAKTMPEMVQALDLQVPVGAPRGIFSATIFEIQRKSIELTEN
jgi:hypothetical protein